MIENCSGMGGSSRCHNSMCAHAKRDLAILSVKQEKWVAQEPANVQTDSPQLFTAWLDSFPDFREPFHGF